MGFCVIWRVEDSFLYWFSFQSMQFHFIVHWNWAPDNHTKTGYSQFGSPLQLVFFFFILARCCHCHQFYVILSLFSFSFSIFYENHWTWTFNIQLLQLYWQMNISLFHLSHVHKAKKNRDLIRMYQKYRVQKGIPFVLKIGLGCFRFTVDRSVISLRTFNFIDNAYVVRVRYTVYAKYQ